MQNEKTSQAGERTQAGKFNVGDLIEWNGQTCEVIRKNSSAMWPHYIIMSHNGSQVLDFSDEGSLGLMQNEKTPKAEATAEVRDLRIQALLGKSYSWDGECDELNYLGNPLSWQWMTPYEKAAVQKSI